eukprot:TRINITY_DN3613_c0_g1_i20.p1 TRINITY_DN3613_c0_g1~~TRINITY_DN3613_c0_g1_i20.p1  ORF type:complete len:533 (+),score=67.85 TRINITY_DN3613_c0_g1_i20:65-1663(+)
MCIRDRYMGECNGYTKITNARENNVAKLWTGDREFRDKWVDALKNYCILTKFEENYVVKTTISKGKFCTILQVENLSNRKAYAAKVYQKKALMTDSKKAKMVYYEMRILREVNHDYIMKLHEVYETESQLILNLEYIRGGTLLKRVMKRKKFTEKECAIIIKKVASSLDYLHKRNITHRDIKLENIFCIDEIDTNIKLGDFDLACYVDKIEIGKQCGTPGYIAPEIFNTKIRYNQQCDVFSAGVVLYIILSGSLLFPGHDFYDVFNKNKKCVIEFKDKYWNGVSRAARELVTKMLEVDPTKRISAEDVVNNEWVRYHTDERRSQKSLINVPEIKTSVAEISESSRIIHQRNQSREGDSSVDKKSNPDSKGQLNEDSNEIIRGRDGRKFLHVVKKDDSKSPQSNKGSAAGSSFELIGHRDTTANNNNKTTGSSQFLILGNPVAANIDKRRGSTTLQNPSPSPSRDQLLLNISGNNSTTNLLKVELDLSGKKMLSFYKKSHISIQSSQDESNCSDASDAENHPSASLYLSLIHI